MSSFCIQETWKKLLDKPQHFSQNSTTYPQNCCSSHTIWTLSPQWRSLGTSPLGLRHPLSLRGPEGSNGCTHIWSISQSGAEGEGKCRERVCSPSLPPSLLPVSLTHCPFLPLFWSLCLLVFEVFSSLCLSFCCFLCPYFTPFLFFYLHLLSSLFPSSPPTPSHFPSISSFILGI